MLSDEEIKILFYPLNKLGVFNESNKNLKEQEDNSDTSSSSVTVSPSIDTVDEYARFEFIDGSSSLFIY